ncbi:MAG: FG-GAP-like repeat-containing protein, partial [Armatimonadota bacterium]
MRLRPVVLVLTIAVPLVGAPAAAQPAEQMTVEERFTQLDRDGDGRVTAEEADGAAWFVRLDANGDGAITLEEARPALAQGARQTPVQRAAQLPLAPGPTAEEQALPDPPGWDGPPLRRMPEGDASGDAAGLGQLFESVVVPGLTDVVMGTNGLAIADLNRDGLLDVVLTQAEPRSWGRRVPDRLRVLLNQGEFGFAEHEITIIDSDLSCADFGNSAQVPNLADLNRDGYLDILVTRNAPYAGGQVRDAAQLRGNTLLVSSGAWDRFEDLSEQMGIRNEIAYNRQPCFGDVNLDGWLDIAIGCDNIGNAMGGVPHSRLYVFRPAGDAF